MTQPNIFAVLRKHLKPNDPDLSATLLLGYLLEWLEHSHTMNAVAGFGGGAENKSTVFSEIQAMMGLSGRKDTKLPTSILATIQFGLFFQWWMDNENAKAKRADSEYLTQKSQGRTHPARNHSRNNERIGKVCT